MFLLTRRSFRNFPEFAGVMYRVCYYYVIKKYTFYRLREAVRRKFPEKWGTNSWFLLHECSSTPDGFSQEFLSKEHL